MPTVLQAQVLTTTASHPFNGILVAIDARVQAHHILAAGVLPGTKVIIVDPDKDGVELITTTLTSCQAKSLHIVCHGEPGCLHLGKTPLHAGNLAQYGHLLRQWRVRDIMLVACNVAAEGGLSFLRQLREIAGANIAASARRVGNQARGGSWELECRWGCVNSELAFVPEVRQTYPGIFPPSFSTASNFAMGNGSFSVAVGDFNGDGKLDFAAANISNNSVTVRLGDGTGTGFTTSSTFAVGTNPISVAVGDFNGDGKLDFATANRNGNSVTVRLGDGTGTGFTTSSTFAVGNLPYSVAVGDFNADGKLDFATANYSDDTVTVRLGDGTGTGFTTSSTFTVGNTPRSVAVGDFNADGKLDFAAGNFGGNSVTVRLGDGTGTGFTTSSTFTVGSSPRSVAVGDFNGDGKLDLATANRNGSSVTVRLGDGTGTGFTTSSTFAVGNLPYSVAVGDFNADGKLDFAAANISNNSVTVRLGDGTGTGFTTSSTFTVGSSPRSVAVGDFNGDGKLDFATANRNSNNVSVLLNTTPTVTVAAGSAPSEAGPTNGTFTITLDNPAPAGGLTVNFTTAGTATATADYSFTAGTNITAVTASSFTVAAGQTTATLNVVPVYDGVLETGGETVQLNLSASAGGDYLLGASAGAGVQFSTASNFAVGANPHSVAVGDFNQDGKLDFATANYNSNTATVWLGNGTGTGFTTSSVFAVGSQPFSVAVGDFNGDSKLDFATANKNSNTVTVRLGDGTGTGFTTSATLAVGGNPRSVAVGDFNQDGLLDFATANNTANSVTVRLGNGTGTGFTTSATLAVGNNPHSVAVGDFNQDGKLDLATANRNSNTVTVWLGNGTGTGFATSAALTVGTNPLSVAVGDFNGDGKLDLATANYNSNTVTVWVGNGTGTGFTTSATLAVGNNPRSVAVGDFNQDGKLDFATANNGSSTATVGLGDGTGTGFATSTTLAVGANPFSVAVGDFNGDSKLDLATANYSSNNVSVVLNQPQPQATLTIADANPPAIATNAGLTVAEGASAQTIASTALQVTDTEQSAAQLTYTLTAVPANGTLYLSGTAVAVNGTFTQADIDSGNLTYTHDGGETTSDSFTFTVSDGAGGSLDATSFNITVTPVNDAPTSADKTVTLNEDSAHTFSTADFAFSDADTGDSLASITITELPTEGTLQLSGTDVTLNQSITAAQIGNLVFTPAANANDDSGYATFKFTVSDGTDTSAAANTITLNVTPLNDAPTVATPIGNQSATEDSAFSFAIPAGTFADVDAGDSLTYNATLSDNSPIPAWLTFDATTLTFSGTPANGDVGNLSIKVTATDSAGATADSTFTLAVANVNDAPTATPIGSQSATEDSAFTLDVTGTFADVDAGDSLTYSATLSDNSPIPAWLTFDATTLTFNGTPANGDVGNLSVLVTATDSAGESVDSTFTLAVANVNDAPTVATPIGNQSATEDSAFTLDVTGTFADVDAGDSLTYNATLADNSPIPAWLTFDATTLTFSGTPANGDVGNLSIKVTATDSAGESVDSTFTLAVANVNDAPTVATPIGNQSATEDSAFTLDVTGTFADVDAGDSLTYNATLADNSPIPAWLTFDATTLTFSGTPANGDVGNLSVLVTATDSAGATADSTFTLTVANTNDAPTTTGIGNQSATEDSAFSFAIPAGTFADVDAGDSLTYSATLSDNSPIPAWLTFDATTLTFSGTPANGDVGNLSVLVTATDSAGATASSTFTLAVANTNDAPTATGIGNQSATEDSAFTLDVTGNFTEVDAGDSLTYNAT
ncbi:MAG: VCBS repeat-containing protein, partial [Oscillatoria princeps RMCB-10]|nr:VCBS repeat-containing protein [Oscillatoria princeps RMCB-10]